MGKNLLKGWETGDIVSQLISKDVIGTDVAETDIAETDVLDTNVTKENDLPEKFKNPDDIAVNSKKDIIVVIDPGHGVGSENVGAVATIGYKHYIQGLDGNFLLDAKGKKETKESLLNDLPTYVTEDFKKWVIESISSKEASEAKLVLKVSFKLKEILDSAGYSVFLTRETDQAETNSGKRLTLVERNVFANKKKADYFISIHSDSSANTKATGSHSIYRESDDEKYNKRQFEFAKDILKYYTVVKNRYKLPVKNESPEETKRVLTTGNKSLRKVIVELGFTTNPSDYEKMANSIDQIAIELAKGLEENISKHYSLKTNNILGYEFEGKVYKNKPRPFGYKVIYDTVPIEKSL